MEMLLLRSCFILFQKQCAASTWFTITRVVGGGETSVHTACWVFYEAQIFLVLS